MMDYEIRDTVALYMHPWFIPVRRNGRLDLDVPPHREILDAAERLIAELEKAGFKIVRA